MTGSIRQRGDRWQLRVYTGTDADGRKQYASCTVRGTRADADAELARLVSRVRDTSTSPVRGTVGELCTKWLAFASPSLSPAVAAEYQRLVDKRILPRFAITPVHALRPAEIDAWYLQLYRPDDVTLRPLSAASVNRIHAVLHRAFEQAVAWQWIGHNPVRHATPPTAHRRPLVLPAPADIVALIGAAQRTNPGLAVYVRLAAITGGRRGELCALRWRAIDHDRATLHIARALVTAPSGTVERSTKTHAERRLSLDATTLALLDGIRPDGSTPDHFVFSHDGGTTPWRPNYVTLAFGRLAQSLGLDGCRLHDLRHHAATTMLLNGIDVRTAAGRLGHARASTTLDVYAHYTRPADERAAAVLADALLHDPRGVPSCPSDCPSTA